MDKVKGILIPVGGNEDKGKELNETQTLEFIQEGILSHIVKESGGQDARIVVIPTASQIPVEVGDNYLDAFAKLGCRNVEVLNIRTREQAESASTMKTVREANCLMFSGGDQSRISEIIGDTIMHQLIQKRFIDERIVIAGTSAGAMAMSNHMIAGGSSSEAMRKGAVLMSKGLALVPGLIIDSHFIARGRFGRLAEAVATFPHLIGVGLAENTGLIIRDINEFKVIGSGMIIIFDGSELTHNNVEVLEPDTPMSISNLKVHVLANGDRFFIDKRKLEVLPLEAEFE